MAAAMLNLSLCLKISRLNTIAVAQFAYVTTILRYTQYPPFHTLPLCNTLPSQHAILVQVLGQEMPGEMEGEGRGVNEKWLFTPSDSHEVCLLGHELHPYEIQGFYSNALQG